jgi:hypothetical protein
MQHNFIMMKENAEHDHEFSLSNKFCFKEINVLVFKSSRFKQRTRHTYEKF